MIMHVAACGIQLCDCSQTAQWAALSFVSIVINTSQACCHHIVCSGMWDTAVWRLSNCTLGVSAARDHRSPQPYAEAASLGPDRGGAGLPLHRGRAPDLGAAAEDPRLPTLRASAGDLRPGVLGGQFGGHSEEGETQIWWWLFPHLQGFFFFFFLGGGRFWWFISHLCFFFFFKVDQLCTLIPFFLSQGQSTVAQWAVSPLRLHWVKGVYVTGVFF